MSRGKVVFLVVEILIIIIILNSFGITYVQGNSMEPTLDSGDFVLYLKSSEYEKNDIVIFKSNYENMLLIKRIAAISGEMIKIRDNHAIIDNKDVGESYYERDFLILKDQYFVLGDNVDKSEDSRDKKIGIVAQKDIIGRAIFRILPLSKWGKI
ncbi:MAG: signal peptidase I [Clostridiales bacterium]|nr:signal peptidase I [Clostridiales bacterium]